MQRDLQVDTEILREVHVEAKRYIHTVSYRLRQSQTDA